MSSTECYECEAVIEHDETYWSVNVHKETQRDWVITVHEATAVAVFCAGCAAKRDLDRVYVPLQDDLIGIPQDPRSAARILSLRSLRQQQ